MKKITVILMLTMLMSVCAFSAPKDNAKDKKKVDNVHNKYVPNEPAKKAIENSKYLQSKYKNRIQAKKLRQGNDGKIGVPKSIRKY